MSNNGKNGKVVKINPKQKLAIIHLSRGKSVSAAAKQVGVTRQTINNWMKDPEFLNNYDQAVTERTIKISEDYFSAEKRALETLRSIMEDKRAKHSDRIRAALEIQKEGQKLREFFLVEKRLSKLENTVVEKQKGPRTIQLTFGEDLPKMQQTEEEMRALSASLESLGYDQFDVDPENRNMGS